MENNVIQAPPQKSTSSLPTRMKTGGGFPINGRTIGLIISAVVLGGVLAHKSDTFLLPYTMSVISKQIAFFALLALAQAVCLVVGGMNLSVGAICSITTVTLGVCMANANMSGWEAVPITLTAGCLIGWLNGMLITKLKIDSFIITLSMMFVYMGMRSGISGGIPYALPESFTFIGQEHVLGVPYVFILVVIILVMVAYVFNSTVFGRRLLATGGNEDAAKLSGVNTDQMIVWANILSGLFAALAAVLWASKMGSAAPETGDNWVIVTFAVAIIGGTGLSGGVISAPGIFMGGVIFALIKYGLVEMRINDYWANCVLGGLVLLAIIVDRIRETYDAKMKSAAGRRNERDLAKDKSAA
ncbi:MAG: ABC transporter permease [Armatimonadetes bacterium]|nr:ABC transporter permease [Armatimonadota bacterium]